jgi:hypothetical protein
MKSGIHRLVLAAGLAAGLLSGCPFAARAGHPLGTEDAGTLGRGNVEVEFNAESARGGDGSRDASIGNVYTLGISPRLDFVLSFGYHFVKPDARTERVRGMGDTDVTLKWAAWRGKGRIPTVGLKAGATLPTGDESRGLGHGRACALYTLIADWEIDRLLLHANAGNTFVERPIGSHDRDDRAHLSLAVEYSLSERWTAVGEYQWEKNIGASGPAVSELMAGGKVSLPGEVTLDAGVRWGTTGTSANVAYLAGITLGFYGGKAP